MKKVSIRDLHTHTSELVRQVREGAVIVITRRGVPVAELRPLAAKIVLKKRPELCDMTEFWASMPQVDGDSTDYISEDRDRCSSTLRTSPRSR